MKIVYLLLSHFQLCLVATYLGICFCCISDKFRQIMKTICYVFIDSTLPLFEVGSQAQVHCANLLP